MAWKDKIVRAAKIAGGWLSASLVLAVCADVVANLTKCEMIATSVWFLVLAIATAVIGIISSLFSLIDDEEEGV